MVDLNYTGCHSYELRPRRAPYCVSWKTISEDANHSSWRNVNCDKQSTSEHWIHDVHYSIDILFNNLQTCHCVNPVAYRSFRHVFYVTMHIANTAQYSISIKCPVCITALWRIQNIIITTIKPFKLRRSFGYNHRAN